MREPHKKNEFAAAILETLVFVSGVALTAMIFPPAAKAVGGLAVAYLRYGNQGQWQYRGRVKQAVKRLERRGLIVTESRGEEFVVRITQAGRKWFRRYQFNHLVIERQKRWDGTWRIVLFDIPEDHHATRDTVREWLKRLGFARIQQSVWIIPWPCQVQFDSLCSEFRLGNQAMLLEAKTIAKGRALRRQFRL